MRNVSKNQSGRTQGEEAITAYKNRAALPGEEKRVYTGL